MDLDRSFERKCFLFWVQCCANMPSGFRNIASEFSNSAALSFLAPPPFCHTQNVSIHHTSRYTHIFFTPFVLPTGHFAKSPWPMSEMWPMNSLDLRGGHIGEFWVLLFIKWYIYIHNISYRMRLLYWSNILCWLCLSPPGCFTQGC